MRTRPGMRGIGFLLNHASRSLLIQMDQALRGLGLDHEMWSMLQNVRASGEHGADPEEAAARLRMPKGELIDAADRLVRDGLARPPGRGGTVVPFPAGAAARAAVNGGSFHRSVRKVYLCRRVKR